MLCKKIAYVLGQNWDCGVWIEGGREDLTPLLKETARWFKFLVPGFTEMDAR